MNSTNVIPIRIPVLLLGVLLLLTAFLATGALSVRASDELHVPGDYPTIQAAVDAADPGDKIKVEGTYSENVVITKAGIELKGKDAVLDGTGVGGIGIHVMNTTGVEISGFLVEKFDTGIVLENVTYSEVSDVETRFNDDPAELVPAALAHNGLDLIGSSYNLITNVFAHHNGHNGITLKGGSTYNTLEGNTTNDNGVNPDVLTRPAGCGIQLSGGSENNTIEENEILGNAFGILLSGSGITGNVIKDNDIHNNERVGISVRTGSSANSIIGNDATGNALISVDFNFGVDLFDQGALDNTWEDNEGSSNFGDGDEDNGGDDDDDDDDGDDDDDDDDDD